MANPNQHSRDGAGHYIRTPETARQDARAAELRAEGWTFQRIADEIGCSEATARVGCRRALRDIVQGPAEKLLAMEAERLDTLYEEALQVLERDHVMVSHGRIIKDDDGNPMRDDGPKLAAIDRLVKVRESYRRLLGIDRPVKVDATVHQVTPEDIELAELVREAQAKNAVEEARIKGTGD
jgi:hypothetical protein